MILHRHFTYTSKLNCPKLAKSWIEIRNQIGTLKSKTDLIYFAAEIGSILPRAGLTVIVRSCHAAPLPSGRIYLSETLLMFFLWYQSPRKTLLVWPNPSTSSPDHNATRVKGRRRSYRENARPPFATLVWHGEQRYIPLLEAALWLFEVHRSYFVRPNWYDIS